MNWCKVGNWLENRELRSKFPLYMFPHTQLADLIFFQKIFCGDLRSRPELIRSGDQLRYVTSFIQLYGDV